MPHFQTPHTHAKSRPKHAARAQTAEGYLWVRHMGFGLGRNTSVLRRPTCTYGLSLRAHGGSAAYTM
eukprot:513711-Prymnesium_polylepis.1